MPGRDKAADEIFCTSCGEAIKEQAEVCPHCGVRNRKGGGRSGGTAKAPKNYETTVSENWWYGVAAGTGLWVLLFLASGVLSDLGAFGGFLVLAIWFGLPMSVYFDIQYVRANSDWDPEIALWVILTLVWVVNIVAGGVYLYRRHETLGTP